MIPSDKYYDSVTFTVKGSGNNVRVRQVMVLDMPDKPVPGACMKAEAAMLKDCEAEALRLFRLLTAQVQYNDTANMYMYIQYTYLSEVYTIQYMSRNNFNASILFVY